MPELLTKHPDIAIQVLERQGATCGDGIEAKILTSCPPEKFCSLAGGELCVFGPSELDEMTQLTATEACAGVRASAVQPPGEAGGPGAADHDLQGSVTSAFLIIGAVLAGVALSATRYRHLHRPTPAVTRR